MAKTKKMSKTLADRLLADWNETTCRWINEIRELRELGYHSEADQLQDHIDEYDEFMRDLGLLPIE